MQTESLDEQALEFTEQIFDLSLEIPEKFPEEKADEVDLLENGKL